MNVQHLKERPWVNWVNAQEFMTGFLALVSTQKSRKQQKTDLPATFACSLELKPAENLTDSHCSLYLLVLLTVHLLSFWRFQMQSLKDKKLKFYAQL